MTNNHEKGSTMNTTSTTMHELAREAAQHFETRTRASSGESYVTAKDGSPEWITDMAREAHNGGLMLPDDWRYEKIRDALGFIGDHGADDEEDASDQADEFCGEAVDIYNADRLAWLASNLNRAAYCDEAADELGRQAADTFQRIGLGQYAEAAEIFHSVIASLAAELHARDAAA